MGVEMQAMEVDAQILMIKAVNSHVVNLCIVHVDTSDKVESRGTRLNTDLVLVVLFLCSAGDWFNSLGGRR